jgi:hypothetical protein
MLERGLVFGGQRRGAQERPPQERCGGGSGGSTSPERVEGF